ncbi:MAG TPA: hypothetical protein VG146_09810 [Verrucomicrobiae bacterium]|nr:hypothetical protein [Verrucomicrobiae bacterium]
MTNKYVIKWKSKVNGRAGKGTKLFDLEQATQLVEELNTEYPDIDHELLAAGPQHGAAPFPTEPRYEAPTPNPEQPNPIHVLSFRQ